MGGFLEAVQKGWLEEVLNKANRESAEAIENKDRILVGVNELIIPPEEEEPIREREIPQETAEA